MLQCYTWCVLFCAHSESVIVRLYCRSLQNVYDSSPLPLLEHYATGGLNAHLHREDKRYWSGSGAAMVPMGANIALFLHNCGAEWEVR